MACRRSGVRIPLPPPVKSPETSQNASGLFYLPDLFRRTGVRWSGGKGLPGFGAVADSVLPSAFAATKCLSGVYVLVDAWSLEQYGRRCCRQRDAECHHGRISVPAGRPMNEPSSRQLAQVEAMTNTVSISPETCTEARRLSRVWSCLFSLRPAPPECRADRARRAGALP